MWNEWYSDEKFPLKIVMREKNHLKLFPIHTRVHSKIPFLLESVIIWRRLWTMDHSSSSLQVPLPCDSGPDAISVLILFSVNNSYRLSTPEDMVQQFNFFNVKKKNSNLGLVTQAPAPKFIVIHVTTPIRVTEMGSSQLYSATTKRESTLFLLSGLFVVIDTALLSHLFLLLWCCDSFMLVCPLLHGIRYELSADMLAWKKKAL